MSIEHNPPSVGGADHGDLPGRQGYAWYVVGVLMFAYVVSFIDRLILALLVQPIKTDLDVSDTQIGLLAGIGFALFYCVLGLPLARLVDRANRKWLIIGGVTLWSAMTAASAFADSYLDLLLARIGVGVGEAVLTPAAASIIADYFARDRVAKALGVYSVGLYLGSGLALLGGSVVVQAVVRSGPVVISGLGVFNPWQLAFLVAAVPGVVVVALMLSVREPPRSEFAGSSQRRALGTAVSAREVLAFLGRHRRLLAAHFIGYGAIGTAVTAYLVWAPEMLRRTYGVSAAQAGLLYGVLLVSLGAIGPYLGGWWAQRCATRRQPDAEIRVTIIAACVLTPFIAIAPLMPSLTLAAVMLAPVVLLLAVPQGLASAVLQLITPNNMRGQVLSVFVLLAVIFAYTVGPTAVPLCAKWIFGSEQALGRALALVCGFLVPVAALALATGRKPYRELMIASGRIH